MLNPFDFKDTRDYVAGFPVYPHRGIETVIHLIDREMDHETALKKGKILSNRSQRMTAEAGYCMGKYPGMPIKCRVYSFESICT